MKSGLDLRGLQEASRDDLSQALALLDIKQGQELRGVLSTLLLHYILLEVFLQPLCHPTFISHEYEMINCLQDIVLEAEGSVAEDPKDCSTLHIYV